MIGQFREARKQDPTEGKYRHAGGLASFPSKEEQSKRNANEKEKHFPILPSPSLFPLRAFLFSFPFLFSPLLSFSVKNEHEGPAVAAHNTLARLSLLSGLGLTFQQGPGASFSVCLPHLESVRHVRTGLVQQHDPQCSFHSPLRCSSNQRASCRSLQY